MTMMTFSFPRPWSWRWSWTACTEESATRASIQTQSSSTQRSASLCFVRKVLKVFKNIFQGAGRVAFSNQQSYIAAISARFVQLQHGEIDKRVEVGRMKIIESEKYLFFEHLLFFVLYPLLQQFSSKVKPYVLDDQLCDECQGGRYSDK